MKFEVEIPVRFAHCDAAGIVFYPRYFEMINQTVEDWFAAMGADFRTIHVVRREAVPTVHIAVEFHAASRLGDRLRFELAAERLGRSSVELAIGVFCGAERRLTVRQVIAYVRVGPFSSIPVPDEIRARMLDYLKG
jgi:4-hydroxybenzoyl-CoA thioesterase